MIDAGLADADATVYYSAQASPLVEDGAGQPTSAPPTPSPDGTQGTVREPEASPRVVKPKKKGKRRKSKAKVKLFTPAVAGEAPAAVPEVSDAESSPTAAVADTAELPPTDQSASEAETAQEAEEQVQAESTTLSTHSVDEGPDLTALLGDGSRINMDEAEGRSWCDYGLPRPLMVMALAAGNCDEPPRPRTASNGTVSSVSTEEAGTPRPLSPTLQDIGVKFDTVYSYEVIEIGRKQQAYSRFVEVRHQQSQWLPCMLIARAAGQRESAPDNLERDGQRGGTP